MTDAEIIKALECCKNDTAHNCKPCPLHEIHNGRICITTLSEEALDLINRQKATIERLQTMCSEMRIGMKVLKRKAIKRFAERLKTLFSQYADYDTLCVYEVKDRITKEEAEAALRKEDA